MALSVLHVVESLAPEAGSVAVSLRGLFRALDERDTASSAVTLDASCPRVAHVETTTFDPTEGARLVADADVVHIHGWGSELARAMATAARRAAKPYLLSPLGGLCEGPYRRHTWRDKLRGVLGDNALVRGAAAVTALNERERRDLAGRRINAHVPVLPYGIDVSEYEGDADSSGDPEDVPRKPHLLLLGPIHPIEGHVPLFKAFAELAYDAEDWSIVVAGSDSGDWRKMLEAAIRRKGGNDRVAFVPARDVPEQRRLLLRCTLLVAPGLHPRCPLSVMQAVACGVTVIVSDRVVPDGLNGNVKVCEPGKTAIKEVLRWAFDLSQEDRSALTSKARDAGRSLFDWSVLADRYVELYRGLA